MSEKQKWVAYEHRGEPGSSPYSYKSDLIRDKWHKAIEALTCVVEPSAWQKVLKIRLSLSILVSSTQNLRVTLELSSVSNLVLSTTWPLELILEGVNLIAFPTKLVTSWWSQQLLQWLQWPLLLESSGSHKSNIPCAPSASLSSCLMKIFWLKCAKEAEGEGGLEPSNCVA